MLRSSTLLAGLLVAAPAFGQVLDPNAPIGIEAGRFTLYPAVEEIISYGGGAWTSTASPELLVQSNWDRHAANLLVDLDLGLDGSFRAGIVALNVDLEIGDSWGLTLGASRQFAGDDPLDPGLPVGADGAPDVQTTTAGASLTGPIGDFQLRLDANAVRSTHDDAMVGGIPIDQSERDNLVASAGVRLSRDTGALLAPFVEAEGGRRFYDVPVGTDGFLQAGNFASLRAGIAYDSAPVLSGEVAIGYHWELPDDPALANSRGITFDANAVWSPREVLAVTFGAETAFEPNAASTLGSSVSRSLSLGAEWAIHETVTLSGEAEWGREFFSGGTVEQSAALGAALVWTPNPWSQFSVGYRRSWLSSPDPLREGVDNTFTITSRVMR